MILGDVNVDMERDSDKTDRLLEWMDSGTLRAVVPDSNTSLRSNPIMDYPITTDVDLSIQTGEGITSDDRELLLDVFTDEDVSKCEGSQPYG